uniref:Uncharacterized protein n=1 Tax=Picea glauca TaxID=3330 RepID=A0A101LW98_PICGL|nr:hypothetical protein ABT39_MTgene1636 [Picea glauca]
MQVGRGQFPHSRAFRSQQPCTGGPLNPLSWTSTRMTNPLLNGRSRRGLRFLVQGPDRGLDL